MESYKVQQGVVSSGHKRPQNIWEKKSALCISLNKNIIFFIPLLVIYKVIFRLKIKYLWKSEKLT